MNIINKSNNALPEYKTALSAGMDLRANLSETVVIDAGDRLVIPTGLFIEIPAGFEAQIRPRSGLAIKEGITVVNSPGTIDADYRGEILVGLINLSKETKEIQHGDRIAQMIIAKHETAEWVITEVLEETERGAGRFGSTGIK